MKFDLEKCQRELDKAGERWVPYADCTKESGRGSMVVYQSQEMGIQCYVACLVNSYCRKDAEIKIYEKMKKKLKEYDFKRDGSLYQYIVKQIPETALNAYSLMNEIGKNWIGDERADGYREQIEKVNQYIYDTCKMRGYGDEVGQIWEKLHGELRAFNPKEGALGAFLSSRIRYRHLDIYKKALRQKSYTIPDEGEIKVEENMVLYSVRVDGMERQNERNRLAKGEYAIDFERGSLFFSNEDVGRKIVVKYKPAIQSLESDGDNISPVNVEEEYERRRNFFLKVIEMTTMVLCFDIIYSRWEESQQKEIKRKTGKRSQQKETIRKTRERNQICFTERILCFIQTSMLLSVPSKTLQTDVYHAIDKAYTDFVMSEECTQEMNNFFKRVRETELKTYGEIIPDYNERKKNDKIDWKDGKNLWFPADVPIAFSKSLPERFEKPFSNGIVTEFRKKYTSMLNDISQKEDQVLELYKEHKEPERC